MVSERNVRPLTLILNCAVVERTVTRCDGKFIAPVVKQQSFQLERKGRRFFSKLTAIGNRFTILLCFKEDNGAEDSY